MAGFRAPCCVALLAVVLGQLAHQGRGAARRELPANCEGCLREPLEVDYFGLAGDVLPGMPPIVYAPTPEAFLEFARQGSVLLIRNATDGAAMQSWSCTRLSQEFPSAKMRREYDWVNNPEDRNLQRLGDRNWIEVKEQGEDGRDRLRQDPNAPPYAPFYWGVREYRSGDVGSKADVKKIKRLIAESVPAFMSKANGFSMFENAELWLGGKGTGARAHMDSHCISTLSVVMKGERRWRIGPPPRIPRGGGRSSEGEVVFDDGVAYKLNWRPLFEFTAREGDAVLFPPGWLHETYNIADECTAALTTQFDIPKPAGYYRSYYNRLRRIGDLNPCWREMVHWASLGEKPPKSLKSVAAARKFAGELFARASASMPEESRIFYDVDGDSKVSETEFIDTFVAWWLTENSIQKEKRVRMPKVDMSLAAEDDARAGEL